MNNKYDDLHFFLAECMEDMLDDDTWRVGQQDLFIMSIQQILENASLYTNRPPHVPEETVPDELS